LTLQELKEVVAREKQPRAAQPEPQGRRR
jgi:hypothetical protein